MKNLILCAALALHTPLAAECLGCIEQHEEKQVNGPSIEWTTKKCQFIKSDIDGDTCQCGCSKKVHTRTRDPWMYHKGKRLKVQNPGKPLRTQLKTQVPE
jgi:hypothetical protein